MHFFAKEADGVSPRSVGSNPTPTTSVSGWYNGIIQVSKTL